MQKTTYNPFHLMIKPTGASCNLACQYCYYLEKERYYPQSEFRMALETLERITAAYLQANPAEEVVFGWQGGEPLLMGVEFFQQAVALQQKYLRPGQRVQNALQTNGTLVTDAWAEFFAANQFLIGISIDGPAVYHDRYRVDRGGKPSHARVMRGLATLQRHQVEVNALVTVNRTNVKHPLEVYTFLVEHGLEHLQFIPIVEREKPGSHKVTDWSVRPEPYGEFLCAIFEHWARHDVGKVFVQLFEATLNVWMGGPPSLCVFAPTCGWALAVEHNGDLYACDHYVFPEYARGNITMENLAALVECPDQLQFGRDKAAELPVDCKQCPLLRFCNGDCPKHRVRPGSDGKPISYLCPALKHYFTHSADILQAMANEIRAGRPATNVMDVLQMLGG